MKKLQAIVSGLTLAIILGYMFFLVPPSSEYTIILFIILVGLCVFFAGSLFLQKKYRFIPALAIILFLAMNYLAGFQIVNTILLVSFIIGLVILIR